MKFKTVAIFGDSHIDEDTEDKEFKLFLKFIKDIKPDEIVINGDFGDFGSISPYNKDKPLVTEGKRLKADYKKLNSYTKILKSNTGKLVYIEGNHENWIGQAITKNPSLLKGTIELTKNIKHVDKFVMDYNDNSKNFYRLGHLYVTHGVYCGMGATRKYLNEYGVNLLYNHSHRVNHESKTDLKLQPIGVWNNGCLCKMNPSYLKGKIPQWQLGFSVVHLFNDGSFDLRQIRIIEGKFVYNGRVYKI